MIYLSIVIPVRNEEKFIARTLEMLGNQAYPKERFELLVVDGRSIDSTRLVVKQFIKEHAGLNMRLLDNPGVLSSCGRNIGVRQAKGQLIGVIDGHVYVPNNQLFADMERLAKKNNALCLGRPAPLDVPGLKEGKAFWIAVARKTWLGHSRNSFIYSDYEGFVEPMSSGFAYDKSVFEKAGYFDESFDAAEDVEFHFRLKKAGILAYTSPRLLIYSYPRESFMSLFKQQVRYGEGRARLVTKHREALTKETLIPALIVSFFLTLPLAFVSLWIFPCVGVSYFVVFCLYVAIVLTCGLSASVERRKLYPSAWVALGVWITHMGLGWGFIREAMRGYRN